MIMEITLEKISKGGRTEFILSRALDIRKETPRHTFERIIMEFHNDVITDKSIKNLKLNDYLSLSLKSKFIADKRPYLPIVPCEYFDYSAKERMVEYIQSEKLFSDPEVEQS